MDTATQARVREAYLAGKDTYAIAREVGCTSTTVRMWLERQGVPRRKRGNENGLYPQERDDKIAALYTAGVKSKEIAKQLGVSTASVARVRKERGLELRGKPQALTSSQRLEVAEAYKAGAIYEELTKKYDVAPSVIKAALVEHGVKPRVGWGKYRTTCWIDKRGRRFIFKSVWERAYAEHLDRQGVEWEYEPRTFPVGPRSRYTPDFRVVMDGGEKYVELHGWLDAPTVARVERFGVQYPQVQLEILGPGELAAMGLIDADFATHSQAARISAWAAEVRFRFSQRSLG